MANINNVLGLLDETILKAKQLEKSTVGLYETSKRDGICIGIDLFASTLTSRLTDAISGKDVEGMTNLINDVKKELLLRKVVDDFTINKEV